MYLVRRVFKVKPRSTRKAAALISRVGKIFEEAGQRSPTRVYMSGGTVPGPANTVYMDWTEEALQSPYRPENAMPEALDSVAGELWGLIEESHIEFYEMYTP